MRHELDHLRFALRRMADNDTSPRALDAMTGAMQQAADRLDGLLMEPLAPWVGNLPLVVVPTGALHAMPWSALRSCSGRPLTVAPSAAVWHRAATSRPSGGLRFPAGVSLVAGPGLTHAVAEVRAVARHHRGAQLLQGPSATVSAVTAAMERTSVAHIACHGQFRADNPLFSCLRLADGPLTVYDLERLRRTPELLVLSACDSGLSAVRPGDELMGLAAALLSLGTQTLVASVVPVPDHATRALMVAFHRQLGAGRPPAEALPLAARDLASGSPAEHAARTGFVCFGAGW